MSHFMLPSTSDFSVGSETGAKFPDVQAIGAVTFCVRVVQSISSSLTLLHPPGAT